MRTVSLLVLFFVMLAGCSRPANESRSTDSGQAVAPVATAELPNMSRFTLPVEKAVELPSGVFALTNPDPSQQAFIQSFAGLRRTFHGSVLYSPGQLEVVDSARSAFPRTSPLWQDTTESYMDDHVVARLHMPPPDTALYYLVHTDGMSGDPAFYIIRGSDGGEVGGGAADVIAFPDTTTVWMYQRSNSVFPKRIQLRVSDGRLDEVKTDRYPIGLATVALTTFSLRRALDDSAVIAKVAAGDSIEVVAGVEPPRSSSVLLVRTRTGVEGWVSVPSQQCNFGVIKGICFLGD